MKKFIVYAVPFLFPLSVFAVELTNPLAYNTLYEFLIAILNLVAFIAFPVLVLFLVYVGFLFVQAQGDPAKLKTARSNLMWALVGALLVLGGKALALGIQATVDQLSRPG
jgi:hypothetical protein